MSCSRLECLLSGWANCGYVGCRGLPGYQPGSGSIVSTWTKPLRSQKARVASQGRTPSFAAQQLPHGVLDSFVEVNNLGVEAFRLSAVPRRARSWAGAGRGPGAAGPPDPPPPGTVRRPGDLLRPQLPGHDLISAIVNAGRHVVARVKAGISRSASRIRRWIEAWSTGDHAYTCAVTFVLPAGVIGNWRAAATLLSLRL